MVYLCKSSQFILAVHSAASQDADHAAFLLMCLWINTEMLRRDFKPFSMYGSATSFHFMAITLHHRQDAQVLTDMCQIAMHSSDPILCMLDRVRLPLLFVSSSVCSLMKIHLNSVWYIYAVYIYISTVVWLLCAAVQLQEFPDTFSWIFILLFSPWILTLLSFISLTGIAVCIDLVKTSQIHLFWQVLKLQLHESSAHPLRCS